MPAFDNNFNTAGPEGSSLANQIDTFIRQDTKAALAERVNLEHFSLDATGTGLAQGQNDTANPQSMGRHIAGLTGFFGYGTWDELTQLESDSIAGPGIGAMWEITEEYNDGNTVHPAGTVFRYVTGGWIRSQIMNGIIYATQEEVTEASASDKAISPATLNPQITDRIAYRAVTLTMPATYSYPGSGYKTIPFTTIDFDTIEVTAEANNSFKLPAGTYEIHFSATISSMGSTSLRVFEVGSAALVEGATFYDQGDVGTVVLADVFVLGDEADIQIQVNSSENGIFGIAPLGTAPAAKCLIKLVQEVIV